MIETPIASGLERGESSRRSPLSATRLDHDASRLAHGEAFRLVSIMATPFGLGQSRSVSVSLDQSRSVSIMATRLDHDSTLPVVSIAPPTPPGGRGDARSSRWAPCGPQQQQVAARRLSQLTPARKHQMVAAAEGWAGDSDNGRRRDKHHTQHLRREERHSTLVA